MAEQLLKQVIDAVTGESMILPFTADEIVDREAMQVEHEARQVEAEARVVARTSALAKLAALGLTADEVAAL
jgi:hypothetical protein